MSTEEIKSLVMRVATEMAAKGPGWAQEGVVLREIGDRMSEQQGRLDLPTQQAVLNAWHDLFAERKLAWGYDLDNATSPFFHVR
jgi:hypothetical protein